MPPNWEKTAKAVIVYKFFCIFKTVCLITKENVLGFFLKNLCFYSKIQKPPRHSCYEYEHAGE